MAPTEGSGRRPCISGNLRCANFWRDFAGWAFSHNFCDLGGCYKADCVMPVSRSPPCMCILLMYMLCGLDQILNAGPDYSVVFARAVNTMWVLRCKVSQCGLCLLSVFHPASSCSGPPLHSPEVCHLMEMTSGVSFRAEVSPCNLTGIRQTRVQRSASDERLWYRDSIPQWVAPVI